MSMAKYTLLDQLLGSDILMANQILISFKKARKTSGIPYYRYMFTIHLKWVIFLLNVFCQQREWSSEFDSSKYMIKSSNMRILKICIPFKKNSVNIFIQLAKIVSVSALEDFSHILNSTGLVPKTMGRQSSRSLFGSQLFDANAVYSLDVTIKRDFKYENI